MPTATVLPPLAPFQEISRLLAWLNYLWACYQALLGNYRALKAENAQLRERAAEAEQRASEAEQRASEAEQRAAEAEQRASEAEQRASEAEQRAAYAEKRTAYAEKRASDRRVMNGDLHEEISILNCRVEDARNDAYEAEQRAVEAEQRAYYAEKVLNALHEQKDVEVKILHELSMDRSWTSVSKGNFVGKQTKAVLNARRETLQCQAKFDQLTQLMLDLKEQLPLDIVTQSTVNCPVILFPSLETLDPKIVNKESAFKLKNSMNNKFPIGHGATIQKVYECADLKNMFAAIQKILKLCGRDLDE